jgi:pimeloyl-ACP methyl ester carboxylesterase
MERFDFVLPGGGTISGRFSFPTTSQNRSHLPLIVCIPGGSYDAEYFDVDENHSIASTSVWAGIPVISLTRPGYGSSTPVPMDDVDKDTTYAQAQGKYLNSVVLPYLWEQFSERTGATAIVMLSHSIGAMMATIAAGSYTGREGYPLAGLITSGIGAQLAEGPREVMLNLLNETTGLVHFDVKPKDAIMLQIPMRNVTDYAMSHHTEHLNQPVPSGELQDINMTWLTYWREYSNRVSVPVMHALAEFDGLWTCSPELLESYKGAFLASPKVTCEMIPMAPHCIELSLQSRAWYMKCCSFAMECAVWYSLRSDPPLVPIQRGEEELNNADGMPSSGITTLVYTTTTYDEKKL